MTNYEIVADLINHIHTKDQLALFVLQMIQQGETHNLENIERVYWWLDKEADRTWQ